MTLNHVVGRFHSARPPWPATAGPVLAGSAAAWLALTAWGVQDSLSGTAVPAHPSHLGGHGTIVDPWGAAWLLTWLLMVVAMMWPLTVPALSVVRRAAFRSWRLRLVAACLGTVTLLWVGAGVTLAAVANVVAVPAGSVAWQLGWVAVAALATRSARRARVLWRCGKLPLVAPGGLRGVRTAALARRRRVASVCRAVRSAHGRDGGRPRPGAHGERVAGGVVGGHAPACLA